MKLTHRRAMLIAALSLLCLVMCTGCGRSERAAQGFVEIDQAAQAQLQGAATEQTATAVRAHALVGLKTLGYPLTDEETAWLKARFQEHGGQ